MPFTRDRLRSATSSEKTPFFFLGNFRFFFFLLSFFFFFFSTRLHLPRKGRRYTICKDSTRHDA